MARQLTQQEQEEFFSALASHPDAEGTDSLALQIGRPDSGTTWAGIQETIDLEFFDGFEFPPKGQQ